MAYSIYEKVLYNKHNLILKVNLILKIYWQFKNEKQANNFLGIPEVCGFKVSIIATDFHHLTNLIFSILN